MATPGQGQQKPADNRVDSYERVVNGKVIKVNSYAKKPSPSGSAASAVRRRPGRPRIMAQPGSFSSGRQIPGVKATVTKASDERPDE